MVLEDETEIGVISDLCSPEPSSPSSPSPIADELWVFSAQEVADELLIFSALLPQEVELLLLINPMVVLEVSGLKLLNKAPLATR